MNKTTTVLAAALLAASAGAFAQDTLPNPGTDAARQERMNEAYRDHREGRTSEGPAERAENATKRDAREAGHAVRNGVRATGHAIHRGVRATGHAIHHGVDKVTGKE